MPESTPDLSPAPIPQEPSEPATGLARLLLQEDLNFLLTNRIPRRLATRAVGRVARVRSRRFTRLAIRVWRLFADDLRLDEAETADFHTLQECFTRRLRPGARPVDPRPDAAVSPCDALVGAHGTIEGGRAYQAKGFPYALADLLPDPDLAASLAGGQFVTLRLKANMYHRFHAPTSGVLTRVTYVSGDTWNVNPIALQRVESLFCRNERVVFELTGPDPMVLVAVAAIGVSCVRVHALPTPLDLAYRGPNRFDTHTPVERGEELGYFEAGSTILCFAGPGRRLAPGLHEGATVRMGQPLWVHTDA